MTRISKNQVIHNIKNAYENLTRDKTKITYGNLPQKVKSLSIIKNDGYIYKAYKENLYNLIKCKAEVTKNAS